MMMSVAVDAVVVDNHKMVAVDDIGVDSEEVVADERHERPGEILRCHHMMAEDTVVGMAEDTVVGMAEDTVVGDDEEVVEVDADEEVDEEEVVDADETPKELMDDDDCKPAVEDVGEKSHTNDKDRRCSKEEQSRAMNHLMADELVVVVLES